MALGDRDNIIRWHLVIEITTLLEASQDGTW